MAFIKTISTNPPPANLTLKSTKAATSPASAISADKVTELDLITGSSFSAPGVSQKIINGAGLQDIGRADQIIGGIDRGSASVMDQVGLQAPSVQMPGRVGGGMLGALDPESYIASFDRTGGLESAGRGARMEGGEEKTTWTTSFSNGKTTQCHVSQTSNTTTQGNETVTVTREVTTCANNQDSNIDTTERIETTVTKDNGDGTQTTETSSTTSANGQLTGASSSGLETSPIPKDPSDCQNAVIGGSGVLGTIAGGALAAATLSNPVGWAGGAIAVMFGAGSAYAGSKAGKEICKNPNPMDDDAYGGSLKDPFGIVSDAQAKRLFPITKILDPAIDPNPESNTNGIYTGPSLGAVTGSNGGTSTGSWNNPYGFGGYSGPSIDAIAFSNGGSSTGTFDPLF